MESPFICAKWHHFFSYCDPSQWLSPFFPPFHFSPLLSAPLLSSLTAFCPPLKTDKRAPLKRFSVWELGPNKGFRTETNCLALNQWVVTASYLGPRSGSWLALIWRWYLCRNHWGVTASAVTEDTEILWERGSLGFGIWEWGLGEAFFCLLPLPLFF